MGLKLVIFYVRFELHSKLKSKQIHVQPQVMNDLLMITEVGYQRSRIMLIIITAPRFMATKNQIQLVILEFGDVDHLANIYEASCNV